MRQKNNSGISRRQFGGSMQYKILVVDDQVADLACTKLVLEVDSDFVVTALQDPNDAIELIKENPNQFSAILLDYRMPKDGIQTAIEMLQVNPH